MLQNIALRYRKSVLQPTTAAKGSTATTPAVVNAFLRNMETLGFGFSVEAVQSFLSSDLNTFKSWAVDVITVAKESKGAQYTYEPMYPNFPEQVWNASDVELFLNSVMHYFGDEIGVRILPEYQKQERFPLSETVNLTVLNIMDETGFVDIFRNLLEANISWSTADVEAVENLLVHLNRDTVQGILPNVEIGNKENLAHLACLVRGDIGLTRDVFNQLRTATDVLRVAAAYSEAHPDLKDTSFKFGKVTRPERKLFVETLENLDSPAEEYAKNRALWKRFNRRLHVNEIATSSRFRDVFKTVHTNTRPVSWSTRLEAAFTELDVKTVVDLLTERPGMFTRQLHHVLSISSDDEQEYAFTKFWEVSSKVDTPVLWQAYAHFRTLQQNRSPERKLVFVKGVPVIYPNKTGSLKPAVVEEALSALMDGIVAQYADRAGFGSVSYVKSEGYNPTVPFGLRSSNSAFKTLGRGTTMKFDVTRALRFFIHWKDENDKYDGRVDLDLSAMILDRDFISIEDITYYNLRGSTAAHSGDITSAPNGASEFIDVDIPKLRAQKNGAKYVLMTVNSYTQQKFSDLTETLAGFMSRESLMSGEIYEPATVENSFSVHNPTTMVAPILFDITTGEAVWLDFAVHGSKLLNNVGAVAGNIRDLLKTYSGMYKVTVDDVIKANIEARGAYLPADRADAADTIIRLTNDDTNTVHFDEILTKWL